MFQIQTFSYEKSLNKQACIRAVRESDLGLEGSCIAKSKIMFPRVELVIVGEVLANNGQRYFSLTNSIAQLYRLECSINRTTSTWLA